MQKRVRVSAVAFCSLTSCSSRLLSQLYFLLIFFSAYLSRSFLSLSLSLSLSFFKHYKQQSARASKPNKVNIFSTTRQLFSLLPYTILRMSEPAWSFCSSMTSLVVRHCHQIPSDVSLRSIRELRADLDKAVSGLAWKRAYVFELFSPSPISDPSSRVCSLTRDVRRRLT